MVMMNGMEKRLVDGLLNHAVHKCCHQIKNEKKKKKKSDLQWSGLVVWDGDWIPAVDSGDDGNDSSGGSDRR
jgi:hypothetical protein